MGVDVDSHIKSVLESNEEVLRQVQEERTLIKTVGHICNSLLSKVIEREIERKKTRERPRTLLLEHLMNKNMWRLKVRATL